jgi:hypothetical protein
MTLASGTAAPLGSLTVPGNRATALLGYQQEGPTKKRTSKLSTSCQKSRNTIIRTPTNEEPLHPDLLDPG